MSITESLGRVSLFLRYDNVMVALCPLLCFGLVILEVNKVN